MTSDLNQPTQTSDPTFASLVGGIIDDAQNLITQQFALLRTEVKEEIRQARNAAISLGIGGFILAVGFVLLMAMLAHLIAAFTAIPLWGGYGLVGAALAAIGGVLIFFGGKEAGDVKLLPPKQTAQALKENFAWLKGKTPSMP